MVEVYYIADSGQHVDLGKGIIVDMEPHENRDLITILTVDGKIKEFSRNFSAMRFDVVNELTSEQLEDVCGGMSQSQFDNWRCEVLNESR